MPSLLRYDPAIEDFKKAFNGVPQQIAVAATGAIRDAAKLAVASGKSEIAAAGLGSLTRGLRAKIDPPSGVSLTPSALIFHRLGFISVFEFGAVIRGKPLLWIPLPAVPKVKGRPIPPKQMARQFGRLVSIEHPGKPPMLGIRVPVGPSGKITRLTRASLTPAKSTPKRISQVQVIPMYVGVPQASIAKRLSISEVVRRAADLVGSFYQQNLKVSS
jgi:hypothetical protein